MDVREKLVELIVWIEDQMTRAYPYTTDQFRIETTVDHLIANGVTVQELDGCEYCKEDNEGFRRMFGAFYLENPFHGKTWKICAGKCKPMEIYFCPMCGRRLQQPPKGE